MDKHSPFRPQLLSQLPNAFKKWQAFNIAHRAANFAKHEINTLARIGQYKRFDCVRHMRDNLYRRAKIIAASLFFQDLAINLAGRNIVGLTRRDTGKALIMPKIQIGLRTVIRNKHLAMLARRHRSRINIEIGVELAQTHAIASRLQ